MAFWNRKKEQPKSESSGADESGKSAGVWGSIKSALSGFRKALNTDIRDLLKSDGDLVDDEFLKRLFALLVRTDMGGPMAKQICERIGNEFRARKVQFSDIVSIVRGEIRQALTQQGTEIKRAES